MMVVAATALGCASARHQLVAVRQRHEARGGAELTDDHRQGARRVLEERRELTGRVVHVRLVDHVLPATRSDGVSDVVVEHPRPRPRALHRDEVLVPRAFDVANRLNRRVHR